MYAAGLRTVEGYVVDAWRGVLRTLDLYLLEGILAVGVGDEAHGLGLYPDGVGLYVAMGLEVVEQGHVDHCLVFGNIIVFQLVAARIEETEVEVGVGVGVGLELFLARGEQQGKGA